MHRGLTKQDGDLRCHTVRSCDTLKKKRDNTHSPKDIVKFPFHPHQHSGSQVTASSWGLSGVLTRSRVKPWWQWPTFLLPKMFDIQVRAPYPMPPSVGHHCFQSRHLVSLRHRDCAPSKPLPPGAFKILGLPTSSPLDHSDSSLFLCACVHVAFLSLEYSPLLPSPPCAL